MIKIHYIHIWNYQIANKIKIRKMEKDSSSLGTHNIDQHFRKCSFAPTVSFSVNIWKKISCFQNENILEMFSGFPCSRLWVAIPQWWGYVLISEWLEDLEIVENHSYTQRCHHVTRSYNLSDHHHPHSSLLLSAWLRLILVCRFSLCLLWETHKAWA